MGTDSLSYIMDYSGNYYRTDKADQLVAVAGEYTLKVQIMGYTTQVKKVTVSKDFVVDMHFVMV